MTPELAAVTEAALYGAGTPDLILKAHDTFPPVVAALSQNGVLQDMTAATAIKFIMKGTGAAITGTATKLTVATPTATTAIGSNVLTAVSAFTNIVQGGSITGAGIPAGARVSTFDSVAGTITMADSQGNALNATVSASGVALTINKGCVTYTWGVSDTATVDIYSVEWEVTWTAGQIQTFPNSGYGTIQVVADLENA